MMAGSIMGFVVPSQALWNLDHGQMAIHPIDFVEIRWISPRSPLVLLVLILLQFLERVSDCTDLLWFRHFDLLSHSSSFPSFRIFSSLATD
jgi:hypothetical protein